MLSPYHTKHYQFNNLIKSSAIWRGDAGFKNGDIGKEKTIAILYEFIILLLPDVE